MSDELIEGRSLRDGKREGPFWPADMPDKPEPEPEPPPYPPAEPTAEHRKSVLKHKSEPTRSSLQPITDSILRADLPFEVVEATRPSADVADFDARMRLPTNDGPTPIAESPPIPPPQHGGIRPYQWAIIGVTILLIIVAVIMLALSLVDIEGPSPEPTYVVVTGGPTQPALADDLPPTFTPTALPPHAQGRIAYIANKNGDFEIYMLDLVTGQTTQITDNDFTDRMPAWSPDGTRLLYVSDRAGDDDLYVINTDGSGLLQLTTSSDADHYPAWLPDGSGVVFARESTSGAQLLGFGADCMDEPGDCEEEIELLITEGHSIQPDIAPAGEARIAFTSSEGAGIPGHITIVELDGGGSQVFAGTGSSDSFPRWSPDSLWLAFVSNTLGAEDIWLLDIASDKATPLLTEGGFDVEPDWSPDGKFIVFASDRAGDGHFSLYLLPIDCLSDEKRSCEDALIRLTGAGFDALNPAWGDGS